jgi:hypothetical protein
MANKKGGANEIPDSLDDVNLKINNTADEVGLHLPKTNLIYIFSPWKVHVGCWHIAKR